MRGGGCDGEVKGSSILRPRISKDLLPRRVFSRLTSQDILPASQAVSSLIACHHRRPGQVLWW